MRAEDTIILKILSLVKGMNRAEIQDILWTTEFLIDSIEEPTHEQAIIYLYQLSHPESIAAENDYFFVPVQHISHFWLYKKYHPITQTTEANTYYYKTTINAIPKKLTKSNLLETYKLSTFGKQIEKYCKTHREIAKKDPHTGRLELLGFLKGKTMGITWHSKGS